MTRFIGAALAITVSLAFAVPATAHRASASNSVAALDLAAAKTKKKVRRGRAAAQTQIACTEFGCNPVPPGCTPRPGRTWSGLETGFDVIVCPYR